MFLCLLVFYSTNVFIIKSNNSKFQLMQMHCLSFILTLTQCPRFYAKKAKEKLHQGEEKHKQYNQTTIISSSCTYNRKHHKFVTKCLAIRNNEEFIRVTTSGCLLSVRPSVCLLLLHRVQIQGRFSVFHK